MSLRRKRIATEIPVGHLKLGMFQEGLSNEKGPPTAESKVPFQKSARSQSKRRHASSRVPRLAHATCT
jgi:hypothetical protein